MVTKTEHKFSFGSELLLVLAAVVWGFAFVAQKAGMDSLGPLAFNGIRFLIGTITLIPFAFFIKDNNSYSGPKTSLVKAGLISGSVLFLAATIQQFGIVFTTAGNAGFITSIYVILVPMIGLLFKQRVNIQTWIGAIIVVIGLYFLSVRESLSISSGDLLVLGSAFVWAVQVLLASYYSIRVNVIKLAVIQFALTGTLSLIISLFVENYNFNNIYDALWPLLYGGFMSVALAFTLQLIAQKKANPAHAAIILSTESVFAAIGGWLILNEKLTPTETMGALLMFSGVMLSQIGKKKTS